MRKVHHARPFLKAAAATAFFASAALFGATAIMPVDARAEAAAAVIPPSESWDGLKYDVFGDRPILAADGVVALDAPKRAQDAALVPIEIRIDPKKAGKPIKSLTLIIDVNPSPVAAVFTFGEKAGLTHLSTRVRVNDYSHLRAIAETADGKLYMTETYVKASGGCSAPAMKNQKEAMATLGQMKLRQFPPDAAAGTAEELQLMIRHPNNSGLQMDQLTRYFIPPHFVQTLTVSQDDAMIMTMEAGISISEDPNFRFDFKPNGAGEIKVEAVDTKGKVFHGAWPVEAAGL